MSDNLDLVCAVIEKTAMEKAALEIDDVLMNAYVSRRKHREQRPGQAYFDMDVFAMSRYPMSLPEPLSAKPGGLLPAQLRVYEDFARIPRTATHVSEQVYDSEDTPHMARPDAGFGYAYSNPSMNQVSPYEDLTGQATTHQILERCMQCLAELETLARQTNAPNFASLPPLHDIRMVMRQVPMLALANLDKVDAARTFAQKVVSLVYKSETQLMREMYVVLLEQLCEISVNIRSLVLYWLNYVDDERKYNVPATVALMKAGLINPGVQDQELSVLIERGRASVIDFTAKLIYACVFEENIATRRDFLLSLTALGRLRGTKVPESVAMLMDKFREQTQNPSGELGDDTGIRGQLRYLFAEWVRVYQHPSTSEEAQSTFLNQLLQQGVLNSEDSSSRFYRVCLEVSIDRVSKFKQLPDQSSGTAYQFIDAFSKLIVGIIKLQTDPTNVNHNIVRVSHFSKVLSVVVLVLAQHHEKYRQQFNQRPFLRLFTSLLGDLHASEQQLQPIYLPILTALSNTFYTLQPSYFPGFTFAWLQLISHRLFMPKLLLSDNHKVGTPFDSYEHCN